MKIFIAQQNYHIGNFDANMAKIIKATEKAIAASGELIVFSELAICGYPPRDFLEFDEFLDKCYACIEQLKPFSERIGILIGAPSPNTKPEGKSLFNSVYFLHEGSVKQIINKALLPNYDVFDEYRYFEPGFDFRCIELNGTRIAVTVCEDIWDMEADPIYRFRPMDILIKENPGLMINLSASPFDYTHADSRKYIVQKNATYYHLPVIYCNTVGSQTEIVFDGGSLICDKEGRLVQELPYFEEALAMTEWENGDFLLPVPKQRTPLPQFGSPQISYDPSYNIHLIHQALITGIRQYFEKMQFRQAIVASSGGIDSAVTLALVCEALGPEQVHALLLPSQFSSGHSVNDAVQLSQNLHNRYDIIPIKDIYEATEQSLQPVFKDTAFGIAEENIQSRIRGLLVMALANKFNYILLNTSNKSELATGYGTLYGDMAGGLSILGDLYKTQVYALARYINRDREIIPSNILNKAPSAELRPGQKDSDSLPDYEVLDIILHQYIEHRQGLEDIAALGFGQPLVSRVLHMINRNEYKRNQFCPIIRVSPKAFGIGRRIPIVAKYDM